MGLEMELAGHFSSKDLFTCYELSEIDGDLLFTCKCKKSRGSATCTRTA
jgi:hypothetical protein